MSNNSIPFKSYSQNGEQKSLSNTFSKRFSLVNNLPLTYFFSKRLILCTLFTRYRYNILKPNLRKKCLASIFNPFYWHLLGIRILGNSVGQFSNDNDSQDFYRRNLKFVLKFKLGMSTF